MITQKRTELRLQANLKEPYQQRSEVTIMTTVMHELNAREWKWKHLSWTLYKTY